MIFFLSKNDVCFKKNWIVQSLLFIEAGAGAGAGEKGPAPQHWLWGSVESFEYHYTEVIVIIMRLQKFPEMDFCLPLMTNFKKKKTITHFREGS